VESALSIRNGPQPVAIQRVGGGDSNERSSKRAAATSRLRETLSRTFGFFFSLSRSTASLVSSPSLDRDPIEHAARALHAIDQRKKKC
jgi:hypothetical protein